MNTATKPILEFKDVSFAFTDGKRVRALDKVSFSVHAGEIVALVGPSGSGKSTLLRLALGLIEPTSGQIMRAEGHSAMVFQDFALFPWLTIKKNVEFGLRMQGMPRKEREKIAHDKLNEVGLKEYEHQYPRELSGGQRQRVGVARALAVEPDLLLMDEPLSALDQMTSESLKQDMLSIWQQKHFAMLIVMHTIADAVELADQVVVLGAHPGTVKRVISNTLPRPRDMRSREAYQRTDEIVASLQ